MIRLEEAIERGLFISERQLDRIVQWQRVNPFIRLPRSAQESSYSATSYGPSYGYGNYVCLTSNTGILSFFAFTLLQLSC